MFGKHIHVMVNEDINYYIKKQLFADASMEGRWAMDNV